ncbi:MAG: hypothetical protein RLZZ234_416 [Candidatus Parcubacteria bacterium]|jgi:4a-hydroxytetrahydrobiopterin dehydratase
MNETCGLAEQCCAACTPKTPRLTWPQTKKFLTEVPLWRYEFSRGVGTLVRHFRFNRFPDAIDFVNRVAIIAEAERHHPDIKIENYNQVILIMTTHAINDLSENDFIMAAKIDVIV